MPSTPGMIDYLNAGLRGADLRQRAIASNLSNVKRDDYQRMEVDFQDALTRAIGSSASTKELNSLQPTLLRVNTAPAGKNGDMSIDEVVGDLMSNSGRYTTLMAVLRKNYDQMQMAMRTEG